MGWEEQVIGPCRLIRGDCREVLPMLGPVDAVVTDPPYGVGLAGKRMHSTRGGRSRVERRPGHYSHPDTPAYLQAVVIPSVVMCQAMAPCVAVTPGARHLWLYPPADDVGCFFAAGGTGMSRWGFTCSQPILFYGKDPYLVRGLGSRPNSCGQVYANDANTNAHPCAKPLAWMCWLVMRTSFDEMTVLDPFMGSGTTGVACVQLRRSFIGIEIEREYFDVACQRIEAATRQGNLFRPAVAAPQQLALVGARA